MDIVGLLKKQKQKIDEFQIESIAGLTTGTYPLKFSSIELVYRLEGDIDEFEARQAIELSHSKYCGVYAMLSPSIHIHWRLFLNSAEMAEESATKYLSLE